MSISAQLPGDRTSRYANEPYLLLLEEGPYRLSLKILCKHIHAADQKHKRFHWPDIRFMALREGMLELQATADGKSFIVALQVEKDLLQVVCDCGSPVHKLCVHAYETINKLVFYKDECYFEQFSRGGLAEFALASKQYFIITEDKAGIHIQPKPGFGKIFFITSIDVQDLSSLLAKGVPAAALYHRQNVKHTVTGYALAYSGKKFHLPLILPFTGKLNKAYTAVKSFTDFIREEQDMVGLALTPEQTFLHTLCIKIYRFAQQLPREILSNIDVFPGYIQWFNLLQEAFPLIKKQPFVYSYFSYRVKFLKKRIWKQYMQPCILHDGKPEIGFKLIIKEDYYSLRPVITVDGKILKDTLHELHVTLLKHSISNEFYLLRNLHDVVVLEYFGSLSNAITIFKPYFTVFRDGLLQALSERYPLYCSIPGKKSSAIEKIQLTPAKKTLKILNHASGLLLYPYVIYEDGTRINALLNGIARLSEQSGQYVLLQRDKAYEAAFVQEVLALHTDFSCQYNENYFCIFLPDNKKTVWVKDIETLIQNCTIEYLAQ